MKQIYTQKNRGFTLVEMLVSLSLFTVVLIMSVGTLLVLIDANGKAQSMQLIMTNFSFAIDSMTREIRTGTDWYCGNQPATSAGTRPSSIPTDDTRSVNATRNCSGSGVGKYISFNETGGSLTDGLSSDRITYYFNRHYYGSDHGALLRKLGRGSDSSWVPLTGPEIDIDVFKVTVTGSTRYNDSVSSRDTEQPAMTIFIKGTAGTAVQQKEFSLQTSVTQRSLDL